MSHKIQEDTRWRQTLAVSSPSNTVSFPARTCLRLDRGQSSDNEKQVLGGPEGRPQPPQASDSSAPGGNSQEKGLYRAALAGLNPAWKKPASSLRHLPASVSWLAAVQRAGDSSQPSPDSWPGPCSSLFSTLFPTESPPTELAGTFSTPGLHPGPLPNNPTDSHSLWGPEKPLWTLVSGNPGCLQYSLRPQHILTKAVAESRTLSHHVYLEFWTWRP
ncbi:uncharacterized protein LOC120096689 [Rattus norvegicus]|uniref:uncharacterized protein LOC120096689 n=1 Tax=Rattus norvegicus TaxID=10116 RepID=UPI001916CB05|nr:uncharacterized protein LOC120096689 [Rattus norvegicus]XP_038948803.1 uncharacterized protein LOC120096689 [Rattus norvegicus]